MKCVHTCEDPCTHEAILACTYTHIIISLKSMHSYMCDITIHYSVIANKHLLDRYRNINVIYTHIYSYC